MNFEVKHFLTKNKHPHNVSIHVNFYQDLINECAKEIIEIIAIDLL